MEVVAEEEEEEEEVAEEKRVAIISAGSRYSIDKRYHNEDDDLRCSLELYTRGCCCCCAAADDQNQTELNHNHSH